MKSRPVPVPVFAVAALAPFGLVAAGALAGGLWAAAALLYMTLFALVVDQAVATVAGDAGADEVFPLADAVLVAVALAHLAALPLVTWAIAGDSGLSVGAQIALLIGAGLAFGQVANPAAHELIHRGNRWLHRLGALVFATLLFGHHASAHRLVHHVHAASAEDPNTARAGEGFYRFFLRAWRGSFLSGLRAEAARGRSLVYAGYLGASLGALVLAHAIAGWGGVAVWGGLALHAQVQLLLSDYVQHYGLTRTRRADGRLEPVAARHSWNAPHWFSGAMMLNAPRHSDHHAHPARPYPALRLPAAEAAPMLPWPLPVACTIALLPPLWRRAIAPHLARWSGAGQASVTGQATAPLAG